jgi:hypothetical protein
MTGLARDLAIEHPRSALMGNEICCTSKLILDGCDPSITAGS